MNLVCREQQTFMNRNCLIRLFFVFITGPAALLTVTSGQAASVIDEFRVGLLYHDFGVWSGTSREEGIDVNAELVFSPSWSILGGEIHPVAGLSLNDRGDTSKIYVSGVYEYTWNNGAFIDLGLGLTLHNGETDDQQVEDKNLLGSPVLFRISIEPGFTFNIHHRVSLMFDHVSNGYLAEPNEGLDTLGIRYGYRF